MNFIFLKVKEIKDDLLIFKQTYKNKFLLKEIILNK
jgi:hypothetical protein